MVYAVDFDGTICEDAWPRIGREHKRVVRWLVKARERGDEVVLWTCREGELLDEAVVWCRKRGLEFDAVNENVAWVQEKYGRDCRKVWADCYVDDKAISGKKLVRMIAGGEADEE